MTTTIYAKKRGITRQAVLKAITNGHRLPHVIALEKIGFQYVLTVNLNGLENDNKKQ